MSEKIGRSTCVVCHAIKERTEMAQHEFYEETGKSSGVNISTNPSRRKSTRIGASERTYKRKKTVWICNDCWVERPIWLTTFLKTLLLSPIYPLLYQGYSKFGVVVGSLLYFIFGLAWSFSLIPAFSEVLGLNFSVNKILLVLDTVNGSIPEDWTSPIMGLLWGPSFFAEWGLIIHVPITAFALFFGWILPITQALFGSLRNQQNLPNSRIF